MKMIRPNRGLRPCLQLAVIGMLLGAVVPTTVAAHEVRPGYLELRESTPGVFRVLWKKPPEETSSYESTRSFPTAVR